MTMPLFQLLGVGSEATADQELTVGRVARTTWWSTLRMDQQQQLHAYIAFDHDRLALRELEIVLAEYVEDGLVQARRLRLSGLQLPTTKPGTAVEVVLPTLGQKVARQVRLSGRDGRLLDSKGRNYFVEQINVAATDDETGATATVSRPTTPSMVKRLAALDDADHEFRRLADDGLAHRILTTPRPPSRRAEVKAIRINRRRDAEPAGSRTQRP
ncbi:hypothetical protein [Streptacidiphilus fuscans]|uniref:Uncharacterized protein n=1 Tax=Streptacidiphilus fuscans TaxID=2789292 RepID=A0A931B7W1_9ACTN|nr:hypothetical protein [Streptacidiphilus fuscans]MBF9072835.1 hypothetical protein [Streptacidiphilus fuscans]